MEGNVRNVQCYKKIPVIAVLETPQHFKLLLFSTLSSSLLLSPDPQESLPTTPIGKCMGHPWVFF